MEEKTMSEQEQPTGLGTLFLEAMFKKYDDISSMIKTSTIPQFKKFVKNVALTLLVVFIGSLILVAMGTTSEVKILTVIGRLGLIFTGVIFFFVATPIGYVFAGRKYVTFIRSFAVYQLFITLVIWISPMPVSASLLFGLSFAGCLLAFANVLESNPGIVRIFTTLIFAGLLAATYFPSFRDKFDSHIIGMNEPSLIQIYTGDLKAGKIKLFLNGKPNAWYFITPDGTYELFDHSGYHDIYQSELKPITPEIAKKVSNEENLLSPRNLQKSAAVVTQAPDRAPAHNLIEIRSIQTRERFEDVTAIVNAMVNQGELSNTCVQAQPQKWEILDIASYDLNNDGINELLIAGNPPCAFGARMPMFWVYMKTSHGYQRLLNASALDNLYVSDQRTNGFRDLVTKVTTGAGTETYLMTFKYNGQEYREAN